MPPSSPSVLVIRLDAIGDALALTPVLAALQERAVPVDLVLSDANAEIFSKRAARRVVVARTIRQRASDRSNLASIDALGDELKGAGYTHVLVATEDPAGYRLARATQAPVRAGFTNLFGKPFKSLWSLGYINVRVYRSAGLDPRAPHECQVLFGLARPIVGDEPPPRDADRLRPLVLDETPERQSYVAVQITDKWERIGVGDSDVAAAIESTARAHPVRLVAAEREGAYADRIARATGLSVERFATLAPWKTAIAASRAILTPDSGALHVAGAIGTPVVAVFPPSRRFELQVARWSPWAAPYRIVRAEEDWPRAAASALGELL